MSAHELTISIATADDAELLTQLSITTFCETFMADNKKEDMDKYIAEEMNVQKLTGELDDAGNIFFLIACDGVTVGYAKMRAAKIPDGLSSTNPMELERIYVLKAYLDKKIGNALMNHCMNHAINNQHDVMWLGVWERNYRAVNFYKSRGFESFGSHDFVLGEDVQTDMLMKKQL
jgi:diamine N-acetyltransferase